MNAFARSGLALLIASLLVACAGTPVRFDAGGTGAGEAGRAIEAEACGFQLLLFLPLGVNSRQERAWLSLKEQAAGKPVVDVEVEERWIYGFVGTSYCTRLRGRLAGG